MDDFQVIERREISLLQLWLLQERLNGDIGTFGLRIEGAELSPDERLAEQLCELISPHIEESAASAFRPPTDTGGRLRVNVSFQGWKPGSIEILVAFGVTGGGVFQFFKNYPRFRKGVAMFIKDLNDHGPTILEQLRRFLNRRGSALAKIDPAAVPRTVVERPSLPEAPVRSRGGRRAKR